MKITGRNIYRGLPITIKTTANGFIGLIHKSLFYLTHPFQKSRTGIYNRELLDEYNIQRPFGPRPQLCYAPFASMFFSVFGKVSPCYATYPKLKTRWQESTIKELWKSQDFQQIRKQVISKDLSDHCSFCHIPLINKNYGSMLARKYDHYQFHVSKYPCIMEFELENTCNLQCIMCNGFLSSSIRQNREKNPPLPKQYDKRFVDQLEEFIPHLQVAEFTGGDPFLIDMYYDIWDRISAINPDCNLLITTNANTYNEKVKKVLEQFKNICFNISIDSLKKEVYEKIRVNGNFEKAMNNIAVFHNYCKKNGTTLNFLVCPLQVNWKEFPDFISYGNANGISIYFHMVIKPENLALWSMHSSELKTVSEYLNSFDFPAGTPVEKQNRENYFHLAGLISTWYHKAIEREKDDNYKYKSIDTTEKENLFVRSVLDFINKKNDPAKTETIQKCELMEKKIRAVFDELPADFDKGQFLNHLLAMPLDDYMVNSIESTDERTLSELIVNWIFYD